MSYCVELAEVWHTTILRFWRVIIGNCCNGYLNLITLHRHAEA
jgi:hypothetical protein